MLIINHSSIRNSRRLLTDKNFYRQIEQSTFSGFIKMIWLIGMVLLLPVKISQLPMNLDLMDFWVIMGLPVIWLLFILERHPIALPYIFAMWLIFVASLISSIAAASISNSLIAILKEIYLYGWFITVAALLSRLSATNFQRFLVIWSWVIILHGLLIIAQFLSVDLWKFSNQLAGGGEIFKNYRASGLFIDPDKAGSANKAALFQLLGFAPLVLATSSKKMATGLGVVLLASILVTGSMGALSAFIVGLISAIVAFVWLSEQALVFVTKFFVQLVLATVILAGAYYAISQNEAYQVRVDSIITGRTDRSTGERFVLWSRAFDLLLKGDNSLIGIGAENFRVVDPMGKQLHNDCLAFLVERGILGILGLFAFAITAIMKSIAVLKIHYSPSRQSSFKTVVLLATLVAILFESLTHQIFHTHQLWLVLAVQDAMLFRASQRLW